MQRKHSKEDHLRMNTAAWEEGHRYLAAKRQKQTEWCEDLKKGGTCFTPVELDLLGDVTGLEVLQLSCAGDATQAFSLRNMGAAVTATDFSPVAIEEATRNAAMLGIDVTFAVDDSQRLTTIEGNRFDLVHVDGNLGYYEDLQASFANWHRVLRPGGLLFLHEGYPFKRCFDVDEATGALVFTRAYDDRSPEYYDFFIQDFVSDLPAVEFRHTLADILNALIGAGFRIETMRECCLAEASFVTSDMGRDADKLPHDFFVLARKAPGPSPRKS